MVDRILAIAALLGFIVFNFVTVVFVREPDLAIVVMTVVLLAGFDFWRSLFKKNGA